MKGAPGVPILRVGVLPFLMFDLVPCTLQQLSDNATPLRLQIHENDV